MITTAGQIKCDTCGRFFAHGTGDSGTMFGDHTMDEPPEPDHFCTSCADDCFFKALIERNLVNCWWFAPKWYVEAQTVLCQRPL